MMSSKAELHLASVIKKMNEKHCFVLDGDKSRVFIDSYDDMLKRKYYNSVSIQVFRDMYEAGSVLVDDGVSKPKVKTPANAWLGDSERREYLGGVVFDPSGNQYTGKLNLWRGFSVKPKKGNWDLIKNHLLKVISANDKDVYRYIMSWLALTLQKPEEQTEVALVLQGKKGTGKGVIGHLIRRFFATHAMHITSCKHLTGNFNRHLRDCAFLFVDEALWAGDRQHESVLKGIITEPVLTIEGKGANAYQAKNMLSILMASNEPWVVPASVDERRFCVVEVSESKLGDRMYYDALVSQCQSNTAQSAMLYELLDIDLSNFEVREIPETNALKEQRLHSMDSLGKWWVNVLSRGYLYESQHGRCDCDEWYEKSSTALIKQSYFQYCNNQKLSKYDIKDERELGKFLSKSYSKKRTRLQLLLSESHNGLLN